MCTHLHNYSYFKELCYRKWHNSPYFSCFIVTKVKFLKDHSWLPYYHSSHSSCITKQQCSLCFVETHTVLSDFVTSYQSGIPAFHKAVKVHLLIFSMQSIIKVKRLSKYIWVIVNQVRFQVFCQHKGEKKNNKYKTFSKYMLSFSLKTKQKWTPPFRSILWPDAFN